MLNKHCFRGNKAADTDSDVLLKAEKKLLVCNVNNKNKYIFRQQQLKLKCY